MSDFIHRLFWYRFHTYPRWKWRKARQAAWRERGQTYAAPNTQPPATGG